MGLAVAALSVSPAAADGPKHDLFQRVQEQVLRYAFFTVFDNVNVEVAGEGHVVLSGHVTAEHKVKTIGKRVDALDGVTTVINEIAVLPVSRFDDRLRYVVARAIYGNPNFWHYATSANPSIQIVVNRGHVTLTGVVDHLIRVSSRTRGSFNSTSATPGPTSRLAVVAADSIDQR